MRVLSILFLLPMLGALGCGGGEGARSGPDYGPTGDFELLGASAAPRVNEGGPTVAIELNLERLRGFNGPVNLEIVSTLGGGPGENPPATRLQSTTLGPDDTTTTLFLEQPIGAAPILSGERQILLRAFDNEAEDALLLDYRLEAVSAPDVYLLIGQSNMTGSSQPGERDAEGADASDPRILQLNVSENDAELFASEADFLDPDLNVVRFDADGDGMSKLLRVAEDPLHLPLGTDRIREPRNYIGLGLSFAKRALAHTTQDIVLVPAAWAGSGFCDKEFGPDGHWNSAPGNKPELGNDWLLQRAILRTNIALRESGGILRGILWHQGEADAEAPCADDYRDNLDALISALRERIDPDIRGQSWRTADANIPFVAGTMSRGAEGNNDFSVWSGATLIVDAAHRGLPDRVPYTAVSIHDDLIPSNGYPCGYGFCIHFGGRALREMGVRYYDALLDAMRNAAPHSP